MCIHIQLCLLLYTIAMMHLYFLISRPVRMHMDIDTNMQMVGKRFPFYAQFKVILIALILCVCISCLCVHVSVHVCVQYVNVCMCVHYVHVVVMYSLRVQEYL